MSGTVGRARRILYVGPTAGADPLGIARVAPAARTAEGAIAYTFAGSRREVWATSDPQWALEFLAHRAVDVLVIEARSRPPLHSGPNPTLPVGEGVVRPLLEGLFPEEDVRAGIQRDRVIALVGPDAHGTTAANLLGRHGVGSVLCAPTWDELHAAIEALLTERAGGKIAVCLAGGGIEGLFYELGVLRALDAFLVNRRVEDLDLFCGISAGAVLGAFLANGVGPDEIGRAFSGGSSRVDPIRRRDLFDPNLGEVGQRLLRLTGELARGGVGPRGALSSLMRALPNGAFAGARLRRYLRRHLERPGLTDRFDELRRPLFIGATDQDTSKAVVFGEPGFDHVPIHQAVRASAALVPFYAPEQVDGRWYIDGAFTRTTNMQVAVKHGATMVILIDPLVPVYSEVPGYVRERGGLYASMQALKALINGRFDRAVRAIRELYPQAVFYLFRPHAEEMRILSGSPMKYFWRREVEEIAYGKTVEKIRAAFGDLRRDFARHGVVFRDPEGRPESSLNRLEGVRELAL